MVPTTGNTEERGGGVVVGAVLSTLLALTITCYAYTYISVYTVANDKIVTPLFYVTVYTIIRASLWFSIGL